VEPESVYADATALIALARIGRLDLLELLPTPVRVTSWVWLEVAGDPSKPGVEALLRARETGVLEIVAQGDPAAFPQLDAGESSVLSAAAAEGASILVDERRARNVVSADPGLREAIRAATGVLGLIVLARHWGRIATVRPLLDDLIREGFRMSRALYLEALRQAGEL
jgi:predicted nucleic acid-binding protein